MHNILMREPPLDGTVDLSTHQGSNPSASNYDHVSVPLWELCEIEDLSPATVNYRNVLSVVCRHGGVCDNLVIAKTDNTNSRWKWNLLEILHESQPILDRFHQDAWTSDTNK